jgi:hypothetical protein
MVAAKVGVATADAAGSAAAFVTVNINGGEVGSGRVSYLFKAQGIIAATMVVIPPIMAIKRFGFIFVFPA